MAIILSWSGHLTVFFRVSRFNCPFVLGLASSPRRSDGLTKLMEAYIGQRVYQIVPPDSVNRVGPLLKIRTTGFDYDYQDDWSEMVTALCTDPERNHLIVSDILQATADRRAKALVISERIAQLEELRRQTKAAYGPEGEIITGNQGVKSSVDLPV